MRGRMSERPGQVSTHGRHCARWVTRERARAGQMDDKERRLAVASALATEHFVLQTAMSTTVNEGGSRASIYIFALSSSLVALGFSTQSPEAFLPFVGIVLPALFLLGVFTVLRLVDIAAESMQFH